MFAAAAYVSTPGADVETHVNSGGDLGLFMGSEALREHWPPMLAAVFARSRRDADTAAAKATPRRSGLVASDGAVVAGRVAACLDAAARGSPQATVMPRPTRCDDTTIDPADSLSD